MTCSAAGAIGTSVGDEHDGWCYGTDDDGQAEQLLFTTGASNRLQFGAAGQMQIAHVRVWAPA